MGAPPGRKVRAVSGKRASSGAVSATAATRYGVARKPRSAWRIAGCITVSRSRRPKRATASAQALSVPGTPTESRPTRLTSPSARR